MFVRTVASLFGAVLLGSAVHAATVEEFKAEDWDGLAFTSDATGDFTHCSVYATYKNGATLYISYEVGDSWYFSVANDAWKLDQGGSYPIKFKVDGRGQIEGTGSALGPTQIGLPVETNHPFVGQLRRGNRLVISFQDQDYAFELSNSNRAMNAVRDCTRRHVKLGTRTPAVAATEAPSNQESEQTAEAVPEAGTTRETAIADDSASDDITTADSTSADNGTADSSSTSGDTEKPAQASGEQQQFGSWVVTATNDASGNFVNCTAYDVQGDDQLILSYFPDNAWTFGLYRAAWQLDTNQTYYLWYNIDAPADGKDVVKRPVEAAEPTRIFFEVSDVEEIIDRLESGKTLNLKVRAIAGSEETFSYNIEQAHEAFEATRKCVGDHAATTTSEKPATDNQSTTSDGSEEQTADTSDQNAGGSVSSAESEATSAATESADATTPPPLPALGPNKLEDLQVAGWKAGAFGQDDGSFTHCAIKAEYQNGATLALALTAGGEMVLALTDGGWSLTAGSRVPLSFTLKTDTPYSDDTGQAQAVDATTLMADIGSKEDIGTTLAGATEITVSAEGKNFSFDTSDIGPAYAAIDKCVSDRAGQPDATPSDSKVGPDTGSDETASDGQSTANSGSGEQANEQVASTGDAATTADADPEALHTEAAGYTTALLIRSGHANHLILKGDDIPAVLKDHRAVWKIGDLIGLTDMVAGTTDEIQSQVFTSDTQGCAGEISTTVEDQSSGYEHLQTVCKKPDSTLITVHYIVIPRETGGSYMLSLIDTSDGTQAAEIAGKVYSTAVPM